MRYDSVKHHRRSARLQGYDYSQAGMYYVTICTHNRECLFGDVVDGEMILNDAGRMVEKCWHDIPTHFLQVELDQFVSMPNHVHGIVVIVDGMKINVGAKNFSPLPMVNRSSLSSPVRPSGTSKTIGSIIRGFKIGVTKWMNQNTSVDRVWQRNYWEHIIRTENELNETREYIVNNPLKWEQDKENPEVLEYNESINHK
ncbi:hypothetical protein K8S19_04150 [bacterium]|nr:hypothetical protein [bacterium]